MRQGRHEGALKRNSNRFRTEGTRPLEREGGSGANSQPNRSDCPLTPSPLDLEAQETQCSSIKIHVRRSALQCQGSVHQLDSICDFVNRANTKQSHAEGTVSPVLWGLSALASIVVWVPLQVCSIRALQKLPVGRPHCVPSPLLHHRVHLPEGHTSRFALQLPKVPEEPSCIFFGRTKPSASLCSPAGP